MREVHVLVVLLLYLSINLSDLLVDLNLVRLIKLGHNKQEHDAYA